MKHAKTIMNDSKWVRRMFDREVTPLLNFLKCKNVLKSNVITRTAVYYSQIIIYIVSHQNVCYTNYLNCYAQATNLQIFEN